MRGLVIFPSVSRLIAAADSEGIAKLRLAFWVGLKSPAEVVAIAAIPSVSASISARSAAMLAPAGAPRRAKLSPVCAILVAAVPTLASTVIGADALTI